jgi:hypothetical protein
MSARLRQFLFEAYVGDSFRYYSSLKKDICIQIDDQDEYDHIEEFCNLFVSVAAGERFTLEISGAIPITPETADLVEIYNGSVDREESSLSITLHVRQAEALMDLANRIRQTAHLGERISNPNWHTISARTISSLYRFVRILREYCKTAGS